MTRTASTILSAFTALTIYAQQPVDLHLPKPNPAPKFRTGAAIAFGLGLATGVPMMTSSEANMQEAGRKWTGFCAAASFTLWSVAIGKDVKAGSKMK